MKLEEIEEEIRRDAGVLLGIVHKWQGYGNHGPLPTVFRDLAAELRDLIDAEDANGTTGRYSDVVYETTRINAHVLRQSSERAWLAALSLCRQVEDTAKMVRRARKRRAAAEDEDAARRQSLEVKAGLR